MLSRPTKYHDDSTRASDPGGVEVSDIRLKGLHPEFYPAWWNVWRRESSQECAERKQKIEIIKEHMLCGDSRAALVLHLDPLIIAAYSDELDDVAMLHFADSGPKNYTPNLASFLVLFHKLREGQRLLTVNTYFRDNAIADDLTRGVRGHPHWANFWPIIAELVSDSKQRIETRKQQISEVEWARTAELGRAKLAQKEVRVRDGRPWFSSDVKQWKILFDEEN